jgi:hypothetical protein
LHSRFSSDSAAIPQRFRSDYAAIPGSDSASVIRQQFRSDLQAIPLPRPAAIAQRFRKNSNHTRRLRSDSTIARIDSVAIPEAILQNSTATW